MSNNQYPIFNNRRGGQASLEMLIAVSILVITLSSLLALLFGGQNSSIRAARENEALGFAKNDMEFAYRSARLNFASLIGTSTVTGSYTRETIVEDLEADTKRVIARVAWGAGLGRPEEVSLMRLFTNWRSVKAVAGDTGGSGTSGDWQDPRTLGAIDLGPGNEATGLDVLDKVVYLSAVASDQKKEDFFVIDATNGAALGVRSSINTGQGLNAVDVAGSYVYAANNSTAGQLQVIDISDISTSTLRASFTLPGVSGNGAVGKSIFYSAGRIYMGTKQASGPEFHVIDVADPLNPVALGSFEIGADVNAVFVDAGRAYLATGSDSKELWILNVEGSTPASLGSWNGTGTADARSLYLYGSTLYVGRDTGTAAEFWLLNVGDPAAITVSGSKTIGADVFGIRIRDSLAFLGTSDSNKEFQIWNISDPASIQFWSSFNFPQVATGVDYEDNLVYVSVRSNDAVRVITSSP